MRNCLFWHLRVAGRRSLRGAARRPAGPRPRHTATQVESAPELQAASESYGEYVVAETEDLADATERFTGAVISGDVERAKRLYAPTRVHWERIYTDGMDRERGQLDAGLFFVCFQRDPGRQFVPMQRRMAENDALNEYISHTSSAVFACPPGAREGGYVGEWLFDGP